MASAPAPLPGGVRPALSADALYAMMKRKQAEAADNKSQAKPTKRKDDNTTSAALPASKRRKPSLLTTDASKPTDSKKKSSGGSKAAPTMRMPVTAASLVAQRTIRAPTPPPGGAGELPASLAAQLALSSLSSSSLPLSSALSGTSSFSPRAFSRPHWSHEPVSRRNASGQLVVWPLWVAAHSKAQQLVSQGAVRKTAGGKARAQSRRDDVVYSSDDGDDDSDVSDVEADLPDDDVPTLPLRPSAFYQPPVAISQSLLLSLRPDKLNAEMEKLELKLLSKKALIERETRRPYVDMEGGSRHMVIDDPLDKPTTTRQSSTTIGGGSGGSSTTASKFTLPSTSASASTTASASSTGISIPFTKHDGSYICGLCAKPFPDVSKLRRHSFTHMDGDSRRRDEKGGVREAAYVCSHPNCGKSFLHLNSLRFHERSHKQPTQPTQTTQPSAQRQQSQPQQQKQQQQQLQPGKEEKLSAKAESSKPVKSEPPVKSEVEHSKRL